MKIGIFDSGLVDIPWSPARSNLGIDRLFEIVPKVEQLGFSRYWLGEHYDFNVSWHNTEILLAMLAATTDQIRIGVAGVLLNLHSPLSVAHNFKLLEYLFPGRIDLGLAKGRPVEEVMSALNPDSSQSFDQKVASLLNLFKIEVEENKIVIPPFHNDLPEIWLLGTGGGISMDIAIAQKTSFCISLFHNDISYEDAERALDKFRLSFERAWGMTPKYTFCVAGVCAETTSKAEEIRKCFTNGFFKPRLFDNPQNILSQINELGERFKVDEMIFMDISKEHQTKMESYTLLAEVFNLKQADL